MDVENVSKEEPNLPILEENDGIKFLNKKMERGTKDDDMFYIPPYEKDPIKFGDAETSERALMTAFTNKRKRLRQTKRFTDAKEMIPTYDKSVANFQMVVDTLQDKLDVLNDKILGDADEIKKKKQDIMDETNTLSVPAAKRALMNQYFPMYSKTGFARLTNKAMSSHYATTPQETLNVNVGRMFTDSEIINKAMLLTMLFSRTGYYNDINEWDFTLENDSNASEEARHSSILSQYVTINRIHVAFEPASNYYKQTKNTLCDLNPFYYAPPPTSYFNLSQSKPNQIIPYSDASGSQALNKPEHIVYHELKAIVRLYYKSQKVAVLFTPTYALVCDNDTDLSKMITRFSLSSGNFNVIDWKEFIGEYATGDDKERHDSNIRTNIKRKNHVITDAKSDEEMIEVKNRPIVDFPLAIGGFIQNDLTIRNVLSYQMTFNYFIDFEGFSRVNLAKVFSVMNPLYLNDIFDYEWVQNYVFIKLTDFNKQGDIPFLDAKSPIVKRHKWFSPDISVLASILRKSRHFAMKVAGFSLNTRFSAKTSISVLKMLTKLYEFSVLYNAIIQDPNEINEYLRDIGFGPDSKCRVFLAGFKPVIFKDLLISLLNFLSDNKTSTYNAFQKAVVAFGVFARNLLPELPNLTYNFNFMTNFFENIKNEESAIAKIRIKTAVNSVDDLWNDLVKSLAVRREGAESIMTTVSRAREQLKIKLMIATQTFPVNEASVKEIKDSDERLKQQLEREVATSITIKRLKGEMDSFAADTYTTADKLDWMSLPDTLKLFLDIGLAYDTIVAKVKERYEKSLVVQVDDEVEEEGDNDNELNLDESKTTSSRRAKATKLKRSEVLKKYDASTKAKTDAIARKIKKIR